MLSLMMLCRGSRAIFVYSRLSSSFLGTLLQKHHHIFQRDELSPFPLYLNKGDHIHGPALGAPMFQCFSTSSAAPSESPRSNSGKEQLHDTVEEGNPDGKSSHASGEVAERAESESLAGQHASDQVPEGPEPGSDLESGRVPPRSARRRKTSATKPIEFFDSDTEDMSKEELVKLVVEKEGLLRMKQEEISKVRDKLLRSYADMENLMERSRRDAEQSKKFAIQKFAIGLLDVADNLERASSVVRESSSKIDVSKEVTGSFSLLKTLLEGVEMTEKQLSEVFRKSGVEKFDPMNQPFDPHAHNAVFQIPDGSKPPGTVAAIMKSGYMLYDRVIRPAEVGVTKEVDEQPVTENPNVAQS